MISNLPLAITVSLHRLLQDVWELGVTSSYVKKIAPRQRTAQQRVLTEYGLEKMAQRYFEEYQNVLSRNRK